jgi:hypothetical protein
MQHICDICTREFKQKSHLVNHHNRKKKCCPPINPNATNCLYCFKPFSTDGNMIRHIKTSCKVYKQAELEKQAIFDKLKQSEENNKMLDEKNKALSKEIKLLKKTINKNNTTNNTTNVSNINNVDNTTNNNNTTNNITNNFFIVPHGSEDMSVLSNREIFNALNEGFYSAVKLTNSLHFNPKYPEYHNVYISSMNNSYAMIHNGKSWILTQRNDVIETLYDSQKCFLIDNLEQFSTLLPKSKLNALNKWSNMDDDDDNEIDKLKNKDIKKNIELLLYNERKKPQQTQLLIDAQNEL